MNSMKRTHEHEAGIVSLVVTMVMMIVVTLLVLGFAEIARNEQRNTLDDQLSSQAYYAAESGINDVRAIMGTVISSGSSVASKTSCGSDSNYPLSGSVNASINAKYTCVLVDASPSVLSYDIYTKSRVIPLISSGASFGSVTLTWTNTTGSTAGCYTSTSANLPVYSTWGSGCGFPMLRVDLLDANSGMSRATWNGITSTMLLMPVISGSVSNNISLGAHGTITPARCTATSCSVVISSLNNATYYMRVNTIYQSSSHLTITNNGGKFLGAQAIIDSTGRAQDVLRRIRVSVDLTDANEHTIPSAGLVVRDSVCKRYATTNGSFQVPSDSAPNDSATTNTYCKQQINGNATP